MTLVKSLYNGDPDVIQNTLSYSDYIQVQFMCVHVCSCNTCTGGGHVAGSKVDGTNRY
jgi:hypothetical protein